MASQSDLLMEYFKKHPNLFLEYGCCAKHDFMDRLFNGHDFMAKKALYVQSP